MTRIVLKNPYFEEEIKVKESIKQIKGINPKNFAKVEFYEDEEN